MGKSAPRRPAISPAAPARPPPDAPHEGCRVGELLSLLGQPHTLRILHQFEGAGNRALRFGELQSQLALAPKTLSIRLRALVEAGFLIRRAYNEIPPRVEYQPTSKVTELGVVFRALDEWAGRHSLTTVPIVTTVGRVPA